MTPALRAQIEHMLGTQTSAEVQRVLAVTGHQVDYDKIKHIWQTMRRRERTAMGLKPQPNPARQKPLPADWAETASRMTNVQLCRHYGASKVLVTRWRKEGGVQSPGRQYQTRAAKPAARRDVVAMSARPDRFYWEPSDAGDAARFLAHYSPINRCDADGRALHDGFFWRRGSAVLTDQEVIERAERLGWKRMAVAA